MSVTHLDQHTATTPGRLGPARCGSRELARIAATLLAETALWWPAVRYGRDRRYYQRIAATPTYEAWLLTWLPGQGTGLHDHGGASGAFAVAQGMLRETTVGQQHGRAHPVTRTLTVGRVRAFGPEHVHDVVNDGNEPAISLHVYAPALSVMRRYEQVDDQLRAVSSEAAGVDW
jgi:hypothetical protein